MSEKTWDDIEEVEPDDDSFATAEDVAAHKTAMRQYAAGETVPDDAINWD